MHNQKKALLSQMSYGVRKGVNNGKRNLASLYDGVFIVEKMCRREAHRSVLGFGTSVRPYNMSRREPQWYRWL